MRNLYLTALAVAICLMLPYNSWAQNWRVIKRTNTHIPSNSSSFNVFLYDQQSDRGSNYNNEVINYDEILIGNTLIGERSYNGNDQLLSDDFYGTYTGDLSRIEQADSFTYSNGLLVRQDRYKHMSIGGSPVLGMYQRIEYVYNAQSLPATKSVTGYDGKGGVDPNVIWNYYTYNANGQLIQDSVRINRSGVWSEFQLYEISYNANGDTTLWERYDRDTFGNRVAVSKQYFYYNANGQLAGDSLVTYSGTFAYTTGRHTYAYNSSGQLIADTSRPSGFMMTNSVTAYTYTSFGYYDEVTQGELKSNGTVDVYYITKYEYELHWPVNVNELAGTVSEAVTLYPNPATNMLYIATSKAYTLGRIYNSMGQMVKLVSANKKQVDVSELPSGNYYLQLTTDERALCERFTVIR